VPTATVHLQPSIIRSLVDQGMAGKVRISASQPMLFKRAFFRVADEGRARRLHYARRVDSNAAVTQACELIESLARRTP
jgi:hypothetical protein